MTRILGFVRTHLGTLVGGGLRFFIGAFLTATITANHSFYIAILGVPVFLGIILLSMEIEFEIQRVLGHERSLIGRSPGGWLLRIADSVCRKATYRSISQMIADMRVEHYDALRDGRKFKARWITLLHYIHIAKALTLDRLFAALADYALGVFRAGKG